LASRLRDTFASRPFLTFSKRYLREFVSEIRFNGKRVVMRGKKAASLMAAAQNEMGTTRVPISEPNWLLDLGSNQGPTD
jgi:hypothetical protein